MPKRRNEICAYSETLFSNIDCEHNTKSLRDDLPATCIHEAGHAVAGFLQGYGCTFVEITFIQTIIEGQLMGGFAGEAQYSAKKRRKALPSIRNGDPAEFIRDGITICAGPAAERRFRVERGLPLLMAGSSGDHERLECSSEDLHGNAARSRLAFKRLCWQRAQALVRRPAVWTAMCMIAGELHNTFEWPRDDLEQTATVRLPGATARAIMRRAGISEPSSQKS